MWILLSLGCHRLVPGCGFDFLATAGGKYPPRERAVTAKMGRRTARIRVLLARPCGIVPFMWLLCIWLGSGAAPGSIHGRTRGLHGGGWPVSAPI